MTSEPKIKKDYWRMTREEQVTHDISEAICEWKSGVGGEPLWKCEECDGDIPAGATVYFISDGGYDAREGTYVGPCCVRKFFESNEERKARGDSTPRQRKTEK